MIVFNIIIWSIVSAALAWWKSHLDGVRIRPDVLASAGAACVVIMYPVELAL